MLKLKDNEAHFGAELKAIDIDVQNLKEIGRELRTNLEKASTKINDVTEFVHSANSSIGAAVDNLALNRTSVLDLIHNITDDTSARLNRLSVSLDSLSDKLKQRNKIVDDDLQVHKAKLDQLTENWANMTSQVMSLQNGLAKLRENQAAANVVTLAPPLPITQATTTANEASKSETTPLPGSSATNKPLNS